MKIFSNNKNNLTLKEIKEILGISDVNALSSKVLVTPEIASKILKKTNKVNRKINKSYVNVLKNDMEKDHWYSDIDYIGFNKDGYLVNGQHRLKAVSLCDPDKLKNGGIYLKFDFDVEQHISMDTGNNRSYSSQIALAKKANDLEIMPAKFKTIIMAGLKLSNQTVKLSNSDLLTIWDNYKDKLILCDNSGLFDIGTKINYAPVKSSIFWAYLNGVSLEDLTHFVKVLKNGITESDYDIPIIRLRDELFDLKASNNEMNKRKAALTQQCIYNVVELHTTTNRLPVNPKLLYQDFELKY